MSEKRLLNVIRVFLEDSFKEKKPRDFYTKLADVNDLLEGTPYLFECHGWKEGKKIFIREVTRRKISTPYLERCEECLLRSHSVCLECLTKQTERHIAEDWK